MVTLGPFAGRTGRGEGRLSARMREEPPRREDEDVCRAGVFNCSGAGLRRAEVIPICCTDMFVEVWRIPCGTEPSAFRIMRGGLPTTVFFTSVADEVCCVETPCAGIFR